MASRIGTLTDFASLSPPWELSELDQNSTNIAAAFNDSSLGYVNAIATDVGTANVYEVTCAYGAPTSYNQGMTVVFIAANSNTGASTITVSPLGSIQVVDQAGNALSQNAIQGGQRVALVYIGTSFTLVSVSGSRLLANYSAGLTTTLALNCAGYSFINVVTATTLATITLTLQLNNLGPVPIYWQHNWSQSPGSASVNFLPYLDGGVTPYNGVFAINASAATVENFPISRGANKFSIFQGAANTIPNNQVILAEVHD